MFDIEQITKIIQVPKYGDWEKAKDLTSLLKLLVGEDEEFTIALAHIIRQVRLKSVRDTASVFLALADKQIRDSEYLSNKSEINQPSSTNSSKSVI